MSKKKDNLIDRNIFVNAGKKGGSTTAKRGKEYFQGIGKKGADTRWKGKKGDEKSVK